MARLASQFSPLGPLFRDIITNTNTASSSEEKAGEALAKAEEAKAKADKAVAEINELIDKATNAVDENAFINELYTYLNGKEKLDS